MEAILSDLFRLGPLILILLHESLELLCVQFALILGDNEDVERKCWIGRKFRLFGTFNLMLRIRHDNCLAKSVGSSTAKEILAFFVGPIIIVVSSASDLDGVQSMLYFEDLEQKVHPLDVIARFLHLFQRRLCRYF